MDGQTASGQASEQAEQVLAGDEAAVTLEKTSPDFKAANLRSPLPEGVELPFAYHRLNDNTVDADTSRPERRVYVEIRQVNAAEAEATLTAVLLQKDFSAPEVAVEKGIRVLTFSRADGAHVTLKFNQQRKNPQAPDATGTLHLVWKAG